MDIDSIDERMSREAIAGSIKSGGLVRELDEAKANTFVLAGMGGGSIPASVTGSRESPSLRSSQSSL